MRYIDFDTCNPLSERFELQYMYYKYINITTTLEGYQNFRHTVWTLGAGLGLLETASLGPPSP